MKHKGGGRRRRAIRDKKAWRPPESYDPPKKRPFVKPPAAVQH